VLTNRELPGIGVAFWDYLGSRLNVPGHTVVPPLTELVRCRGQPA
jgi:hypothetical protein